MNVSSTIGGKVMQRRYCLKLKTDLSIDCLVLLSTQDLHYRKLPHRSSATRVKPNPHAVFCVHVESLAVTSDFR